MSSSGTCQREPRGRLCSINRSILSTDVKAELPDTRSEIHDQLAEEADELERVGHQYQVQASGLLRSGRPGWEAWFEAGLELKRAAQRLRLIIQPGVPLPALSASRTIIAKPPAAASRRAPMYPYARKV